MPNGWTRVATPEELRELLDYPDAFAEKADELVQDAGAVVGHVFWEQPGGPAYILTHVPAQNADEIFEELNEAIGPTTRIYNTEEIKRLQQQGS